MRIVKVIGLVFVFLSLAAHTAQAVSPPAGNGTITHAAAAAIGISPSFEDTTPDGCPCRIGKEPASHRALLAARVGDRAVASRG